MGIALNQSGKVGKDILPSINYPFSVFLVCNSILDVLAPTHFFILAVVCNNVCPVLFRQTREISYQNHSGSLQNVVHEEPLLYYKSILKLSGVRNRDIIRSR